MLRESIDNIILSLYDAPMKKTVLTHPFKSIGNYGQSKGFWIALSAWIAICTILVTTLALQQHFLHIGLYGNNHWLLFCAKQLLQGKRYYYDFFEVNPPLIIYFYTLFIGLGHLLHINSILLLQAFFFFLIISTLYLNFQLLKKVFNGNTLLAYAILTMIAISECFLPIDAFSEREHLTLILFWPYLLLLVRRCQDKSNFNPEQTGIFPANMSNKILPILIGLFTGFGIALKPHFLIPVLLMESYYCIKMKKISAVFRPEINTMLIFGLLYALGIFLVCPQFYTKMLPLDGALYFSPFTKMPFYDIIIGPPIFIIIILLLVIFYPIKHYADYFWLLTLSTVGFLFDYFLPGQSWYYHLYPALALSYVLLTSALFTQFNASIKGISITIIGLLVLAFQISAIIQHTAYMKKFTFSPIFHKAVHFCRQQSSHQKVLILSSFLQTHRLYHLCSHAIPSSRFPNLVLIPGVQYLNKNHRTSEYQHYKKIAFDLLNSDIQKRQPKFIFIDNRGYYFTFHQKSIHKPLLPFLLSDPTFREFFSHYQLVQKTTYLNWYSRKDAN